MNAKDLMPNHRILLVDDNTSIHADFRKILCPSTAGAKAAIHELEAALFGDAKPATGQQVLFWIPPTRARRHWRR
jgi:hypothetical protein